MVMFGEGCGYLPVCSYVMGQSTSIILILHLLFEVEGRYTQRQLAKANKQTFIYLTVTRFL